MSFNFINLINFSIVIASEGSERGNRIEIATPLITLAPRNDKNNYQKINNFTIRQ